MTPTKEARQKRHAQSKMKSLHQEGNNACRSIVEGLQGPELIHEREKKRRRVEIIDTENNCNTDQEWEYTESHTRLDNLNLRLSSYDIDEEELCFLHESSQSRSKEIQRSPKFLLLNNNRKNETSLRRLSVPCYAPRKYHLRYLRMIKTPCFCTTTDLDILINTCPLLPEL